jgi:KDO2-lipid IV(A) lauroyltransferase
MSAPNKLSFSYWGLVLLLLVWRGLSALPIQLHWILGTCIGETLYLLLGERRRIAYKNIETCFPVQDDAWKRRLLHRHFRRAGRAIFGTGMGAWATPERIEKVTKFHGLEAVKSRLHDNQPVILLAPHFVDVMFLAQALSHELPMVTMYKRPRNDAFHAVYRRVNTGESTGDQLLDHLSGNKRERPLQIVEHRQSSLHIAVREMRKLSAFFYLPDQDLGKRQSVFAPFFGVEATSSSALFRFAELGKAAIIPVVACHRPGGGSYDFWFEDAIEGIPSGDDIADATKVNRVIEGIITKHPEHYFWLHKRFKTRPEGEPPFYT